MRLSSLIWGSLWITAGVLLLGSWMPGADGMATGPRIGIGSFLTMIGLLVIGIPLGAFYLKMTARPGDYASTCPVGEACSGCGAFNLKPRMECRSCGAPVNASEAL